MISNAMRPSRVGAMAPVAGTLLLLLLATAPLGVAAEPALVPRPAQLTLEAGAFDLPEVLPLRIDADAADVRQVAQTLSDRVARSCGRRLELRSGGSRDRALELRLLPSVEAVSPDAYRIAVTPRRMRVEASEIAGLRHGATSVLQLLCAPGATSVPALRIADAPRFAWRGVMLDSARHYQSPEYLRRFLDAMALHKLNVLHWHLTDDQAWRLEIRKYPRLTQIGAWRVPAGAAQSDIDPATKRPRTHGGYYSQDTVRELVRYAQTLGITIVPEVEMPGHASAAIAAYPELGAVRGAVTHVPADWGIYPNAFAVDEPTFRFLEDVLRETMELFPSRHIHVGGDEVETAQWQASDAGKAVLAKLDGRDPHVLQAYFTERIARFLESHGRQLLGWDEILSPALAKNAVVMSWRGIEGAIKAAQQGHDTVLSPWPTLYFDNRQSTLSDEPPGRVRVVALKDVYQFDPAPAALDAAAQRHVLGLQAAIWTEHIRTEARVDHMTFPRAAAIAELGWTPPAQREWSDFARRLPVLWPHYAALGLAAADSAYAVQAKALPDDHADRVRVELSSEVGIGDIRYTRDGSEPRVDSPRYDAPLTLARTERLRARLFVDGVAVARERALATDTSPTRSSRELTLCSENIALMLEDDAPIHGDRAVFSVDIQNPCWIYPQADLGAATVLEARVGQVPFNFQIGAAKDAIRFPKPETREGELEVRLDRCDGELLARLPLVPASAAPGVTALAPVTLPPRAGRHDLCLRFAQPRLEPVWVIDTIRIGSSATEAP